MRIDENGPVRSMRVIVVTGIFPPDIGGPATYVPRIATALANMGHSLQVITASQGSAHDDASYPFRVCRIPRHPALRRMVSAISAVFLRARKGDVILANGLHLECLVAARMAGCPLVLKVVGDEAWERSQNLHWVTDDFETFQTRKYGWRIELLKFLRSFAARRATRILVPSKYLAAWVEKWGVEPDKIEVVYNAADPITKPAPASLPFRCAASLVAVGRLVPWKHLDNLLEILRDMPEVGLVIVGNGPLKTTLQQTAIKLGVADRVLFAGSRTHAETLALMASCDLFVLNSSYEGLPHVILEAMQAGVPVVASRAGGTAEILEDRHTGYLFPPGDRLALKEILQNLLAQPALRLRVARNAAARLTRFDSASMVAQTELLLSAVAYRETSRQCSARTGFLR